MIDRPKAVVEPAVAHTLSRNSRDHHTVDGRRTLCGKDVYRLARPGERPGGQCAGCTRSLDHLHTIAAELVAAGWTVTPPRGFDDD